MNKRIRFSNLLFEKFRIIWHLGFWGAGFFILLKLFTEYSDAQKIDVIYTTFFILPIIIGVYLNLYILLPYLLKKERYLFYLLSLMSLILLSSFLIFKLFDKWIDFILPDYYFVSVYDMKELVIYSSAFIILSTLLKFTKERFVLARLENEISANHLRQLKSQINPHFLLNSLQTIYSLSLSKSDKTPESILKLSEILKFTLYESENELVDLSRELQVVNEYIEMYRLRLDPIRVRINVQMNGDPEGLKIIPMVFLPFIENSLKHGIQGTEKEAFVNIDFLVMEKSLTFTIENNKGVNDPAGRKEFGGIGISNTRKRLDLLYPGKYKLEVMDKGELYKIILTLQLN